MRFDPAFVTMAAPLQECYAASSWYVVTLGVVGTEAHQRRTECDTKSILQGLQLMHLLN
jgi:hypothetical protein